MTPRLPYRPATAVAVAGLLATACGGGDSRPSSAAEKPHGYVAGAEEASEAQWRLVLAGDDRVRLLDPATEKVTDVAAAPGVTGVRSDGRFAYLTTSAGMRTVDSGVWTVDHGDHVHYYKAAVRDVGTVPGTPGAITGDQAVTAVSGGPAVRVLDRKALEGGKIPAARGIPGRAAVAYAEHLVIAADDGTVRVHDRQGAETARLTEPCPQARGQAVTKRGAVLGCADGALLVTGKDGRLTGTKIAYPGRVRAAERATEFHHRPGTPVLAAKAGDRGLWILNLAAKSWNRAGSAPLTAVSGTGEDAPVLALDTGGTLRSYDPKTGKQGDKTNILKKPNAASVIQVDTARAYVNDPAGRRVVEIDYRDGLRVARTFDLAFSPQHMVETGW
ncbi:hypothetical protein [Actinomadura rudentiformis]|uniref:ABC transporter n=1 Tax=Actinomadura rudentiformis TaxID=359158 RepID=A0A6H9YQA6_9ACTN|nr:hypothetical protein [Actinomadura rudentiformis]KAB2342347.1 hypothetical protein F8566_37945 [Actinomadura rudentiformis]